MICSMLFICSRNKIVKKKLEMMLQKIEQPSSIKAEMEQYPTPASIAADVLWHAYQNGDIEDKVVLDAGCGTGIFAIGAALLNAGKVVAVDLDEELIKKAEEEASKFGVDVEFVVANIEDFETRVDTVIMNPPFGAQFSNRGADSLFVRKAMEVGDVIYSLHLEKSLHFIKNLLKKEGWGIGGEKKYRFPIKASLHFHEKRVMYYDVVLIHAFRTPPRL